VTASEKILQAFRELGAGDVAEIMFRCFMDMEDAEPIIAEAKAEHPEKAQKIDAAFSICRWPNVLPRTAPRNLYKLHVRQLIRKVLGGIRLDTPTHVECCAMACEASMLAPLSDRTFHWLFNDRETIYALGFEEKDLLPQYPVPMADELYMKFVHIYRGLPGENRHKVYHKSLARRPVQLQISSEKEPA